MPHGVPPSFVKTASSVHRCLPAETIAAIALRSAQIVNPNERFSTLAPIKISPSVARSAAPTKYPLYGAYARLRTSFALAIRISSLEMDNRHSLPAFARFAIAIGHYLGMLFKSFLGDLSQDALALSVDDAQVRRPG